MEAMLWLVKRVYFFTHPVYSLNVHCMFTIYSLYTHYILTICSLYTHYILTIYSLSYLSNQSRIFKIEAMEAILWHVKCVYFFYSPSTLLKAGTRCSTQSVAGVLWKIRSLSRRGSNHQCRGRFYDLHILLTSY